MNSSSVEIPNDIHRENIGSSTLTTFCNDNGGFIIYAVGYSSNADGNNILIDSNTISQWYTGREDAFATQKRTFLRHSEKEK